jgi:hypothetical protein
MRQAVGLEVQASLPTMEISIEQRQDVIQVVESEPGVTSGDHIIGRPFLLPAMISEGVALHACLLMEVELDGDATLRSRPAAHTRWTRK